MILLYDKKMREKERENTSFSGQGDPVSANAMSVNIVSESSIFFRRPWPSLHICFVTARCSSHLYSLPRKNNYRHKLKKKKKMMMMKKKGRKFREAKTVKEADKCGVLLVGSFISLTYYDFFIYFLFYFYFCHLDNGDRERGRDLVNNKTISTFLFFFFFSFLKKLLVCFMTLTIPTVHFLICLFLYY